MSVVETGIRKRFGRRRAWSRVDDASPKYVVMNIYVGNASIGEHHDGAPLFDVVRNTAVILSLNIQCDGVLFFKLQGSEQARRRWPPKSTSGPRRSAAKQGTCTSGV
jgi:alkylated DNA repair dioxygenase AlkB